MSQLPESDSESWQLDLGGIQVVFGDGRLERLGALASELGGRRALLVTDAGIVGAGWAERARAVLAAAGLAVTVFDGVEENPTTTVVERAVVAGRAAAIDLIVGLGGGSAMDCAKGANFLLTQEGRMEDFWGVGKATRPMLPSIGIPTTAGTGSEAQSFALITHPETHQKMACGDKKARFRTVILDPSLLASLPRSVAAVTAIDALSHALESYVTRRRNPISQLFAREAWRLLEAHFERFITAPQDRSARGAMLLGAHLAGAAIETSMLGAAHSCANPLSAHFDLTHGIAVGLMLPHVVRFNGAEVEPLYRELAETAGLAVNGRGGAVGVSERVAALQRAAGLPARLVECGVARESLDLLAEEASKQWTAQFNPRPVATAELRALYEAAL